MKSIDGGNTWAEQTSPVTSTLKSVYFTSATTGWAVGTGGVIIYTVDGTNWAAHDSSGVMTTTEFNAVYFIGTRGWFGGDGGMMYLTNDGGANFTTPTVNPATDDVNSISFFSSLVGYAAIDSEGIMWTDDGGDTWTLSSVDLGPYPYTRFDMEVILTVDDTTAVASGWGSMIGPQPTIIVISRDAGKTWSNPDDTYGYYTHAYGYGLTMFDNGHVLLVGGGASSAAPVLHSSAGNLNDWNSSYPFFGDDLRGLCYVPGSASVIAVGDEGCIAKSDDYGYTWYYLFDASNGTTGWYACGTYGLETVVVGAGGAILKLDENGNPYDFGVISPRNWAPYLEEVDCDIITYPPVDPMVAGKIWYACGRNFYLCKTSDAGETWTQLHHAPNNFDGFYSMFWFNENDGVIVGDSASYGAVWTTNDGGVNLDLVFLYGLTDQLNSVHFSPTDPNIGVAVGQDNIVIYTTDGGATWTQGTEDIGSSSADLWECHMIDSDTAFAVGDAGVWCKTTDGGQNDRRRAELECPAGVHERQAQ
jgi:photosystem II stability/assembly factor-like uncharacterized protein